MRTSFLRPINVKVHLLLFECKRWHFCSFSQASNRQFLHDLFCKNFLPITKHTMKPSDNSIPLSEVLTLAAQLRAGDTAVEPTLIALFESVADDLSLDDPAKFVTFVESMRDLPLQTAVARQKVAYYHAVALRRNGQYQASVEAFATLLLEPELELTVYGRSLNSQAIGYRILGKPEKAMNNYQHSLAIWQQLADPENLGKVHLNLGILAYELRDFQAAGDHLQAALSFLEQANLPKLVAIAHNELGLLYRDLGEWEKALAYLNRLVELRSAAGATENVAAGLNNIGEIKLYQGEMAEAQRYFKEALALLHAPEYRIDALLHLGLTYQAQGDLPLAQTEFEKALALAQQIERREFLPHLYYHLGDVKRLLGDRAGALAEWQTAVTLIEDTRHPIQDETIKISLLGRWQQIYEALLLQSLADGDLVSAFAWAERARARAFFEGLGDDFAAVATLPDVQKSLPDDTTMLCYFTTGVLAWDLPMLQAIPGENPLREHLLIPPKIVLFAVTKGQTAVHMCPLDPNKFATASPRGQDVKRYLQPAVSAKLFDTLLSPAIESLQVEHLIVIPHGPLHHVPFTAVLDHMPRSAPILSLAPSGTVWWQQQRLERNIGTDPLLAIGYPGEDLLFAESEATAVAALMKGEVQLGQIEKQWLRETAVKRRVLHFACHAQFADDDPLSSYLEVGPDTKLSAREVLSDWQLSAELVVLSACQTGISHILRGDEPMGLIRAFLSAGAQSVLVTQWSVEDLPTYLLMTHFYQRLTTTPDEPARKALFQAQRWLRQLTVAGVRNVLARWQTPDAQKWLQHRSDSDKLFVEPVYWAGFILVGG